MWPRVFATPSPSRPDALGSIGAPTSRRSTSHSCKHNEAASGSRSLAPAQGADDKRVGRKTPASDGHARSISRTDQATTSRRVAVAGTSPQSARPRRGCEGLPPRRRRCNSSDDPCMSGERHGARRANGGADAPARHAAHPMPHARHGSVPDDGDKTPGATGGPSSGFHSGGRCCGSDGGLASSSSGEGEGEGEADAPSGEVASSGRGDTSESSADSELTGVAACDSLWMF